MAHVYCTPTAILIPAESGKSVSSLLGLTVGVVRLPTDPLFYTDLTLSGIVSGSRYRVTLQASPYTEIATGVASSTEEVLSGLPVYSNPMLVDIVIRNASGGTVYKEFLTAASLSRAVSTAFIIQNEDI